MTAHYLILRVALSFPGPTILTCSRVLLGNLESKLPQEFWAKEIINSRPQTQQSLPYMLGNVCSSSVCFPCLFLSAPRRLVTEEERSTYLLISFLAPPRLHASPTTLCSSLLHWAFWLHHFWSVLAIRIYFRDTNLYWVDTLERDGSDCHATYYLTAHRHCPLFSYLSAALLKIYSWYFLVAVTEHGSFGAHDLSSPRHASARVVLIFIGYFHRAPS